MDERTDVWAGGRTFETHFISLTRRSRPNNEMYGSQRVGWKMRKTLTCLAAAADHVGACLQASAVQLHVHPQGAPAPFSAVSRCPATDRDVPRPACVPRRHDDDQPPPASASTTTHHRDISL